ncbi:hypothetical protein [Pseudoduganella sp. HUAS MS19]
MISLLALCLLAACQRTAETKPAAAELAAAAALNEEQKLELAVMRAVFGAAVRLEGRQALAFAELPDVGNRNVLSPMQIIPLGVKILPNGQAALVTTALPPDSAEAPGERNMALPAVISAYLLDKVDGKWKIARRHDAIDGVGSHGEPGEFSWVTLGPGRHGFAIVGETGNRGLKLKMLNLFDLNAKDMRVLPANTVLIHSDNDDDCGGEGPRCWNVSGQWRLVSKEGQAFADLEIDFAGVIDEQKAAPEAVMEAAQDGFAAEAAQDGEAGEIPQREKRQIKSTAQYALSEKGLRLVGGRNAAEEI